MEPTTSKSNSSTENKKKISFNDNLEYFPTTIKDSQSEENDCNDKKLITNETPLLPVLDVTMNPKLTKDTFSKNVLNEREIEDTLDSKHLINESSTEIAIVDEEINEEEISLQIISDKVVLLMMSTGGVADKYTPAVRSMQEGNCFRYQLVQQSDY